MCNNQEHRIPFKPTSAARRPSKRHLPQLLGGEGEQWVGGQGMILLVRPICYVFSHGIISLKAPTALIPLPPACHSHSFPHWHQSLARWRPLLATCATLAAVVGAALPGLKGVCGPIWQMPGQRWSLPEPGGAFWLPPGHQGRDRIPSTPWCLCLSQHQLLCLRPMPWARVHLPLGPPKAGAESHQPDLATSVCACVFSSLSHGTGHGDWAP